MISSPNSLPSPARSFPGLLFEAICSRILFLVCVVGATDISAAIAPENVGGAVLRTEISVVSLRSTSENTIALRENGSYSFIRYATGSFLIESGSTFLNEPPANGLYRYRRIGENDAEIEFTDSTGTLPNGAASLVLRLRFGSPSSGTIIGYTGLNVEQAGRYVFLLSEEALLARAPVSNVSLRGRVGINQSLIAGFVVPGSEPREVLIRVIGPSLGQFGVNGVWQDPDFRIYSGGSLAIPNQILYSDWSAAPTPSVQRSPVSGFRRLYTSVGAFPLVDGSKDAAGAFRLLPGAYSIVASPLPGDAGGEVLIEVYFLP